MTRHSLGECLRLSGGRVTWLSASAERLPRDSNRAQTSVARARGTASHIWWKSGICSEKPTEFPRSGRRSAYNLSYEFFQSEAVAVAVDHQNPRKNLKLTKNKVFSSLKLLIYRLEIVFLGLSLISFVDPLNDAVRWIKIKRSFILFLKGLEDILKLDMRYFLIKDL